MRPKSLVVVYEQALERVLNSLQKARGRHRKVAEGAKVPYHTLTKIVQRRIKQPGVSHIQNLDDYFAAERRNGHRKAA